MESSPRRKLLPGRVLIGAIILLGLAAAVFSASYRWRVVNRPGDFWGADAAKMILNAPDVECGRLAPISEDHPAGDSTGQGALLRVGSAEFQITDRLKLSSSEDVRNLRRNLLDDLAFDWKATEPKQPINWRYALRFSTPPESVTLVFSDDCQRVAQLNRPSASIEPISDWMRGFFARQFTVSAQPAAK